MNLGYLNVVHTNCGIAFHVDPMLAFLGGLGLITKEHAKVHTPPPSLMLPQFLFP